MKKTILSSICVMALTGATFAQGTVNWGSTAVSPAAFTAQTNSTTYSPFTGGGATGSGAVGAAAGLGGFYFALLYTSYTGVQAAQPVTPAALSTWTATGLTATNIATPGRATAVSPNTGATVPWDNGTTNSIMLVGWSSNLGNNYAAVLSLINNWATQGSTVVGPAYFGTSATGYINPGTVNPGVTIIGAAAGTQGLPIFSLNTQLYLLTPVPEPGTMALAALGGASLLLFRRRK